LRTKIALSTAGLLLTLSGCGGGETTTATTTTTTGAGGATTTTGGGGAPPSTTTGAGGASVTVGSGGTGGAASSTGSAMPGVGAFGQPCTKNGECASLLCVDIDATHAVCTKPCANDAACPPAPEWSCAMNGGNSQTVCLCAPSGPEICDGQDNNCDGVVDEGGCPELVGTATGPVVDLEATTDKLIVLTDKTIESVPQAGGPVTNLRSSLVGVSSIALNSASIYWIQGKMHQMTFTGLAQADVNANGGPSFSDVIASDTVQVYRDPTNIWRLAPAAGYGSQGTGPMVMVKNSAFWASGTTVRYLDASAPVFTVGAKVASNQLGLQLLATDGSNCYWVGTEGAIRKVVGPAFAPVVDVITGEVGVIGLAADVTNVYWSTTDGTTSTLWKIPIAGGAKAKIGAVTGTAHHLVASGNHLYFDTGTLLWRSPT
jgi:hypothetical protein